jgi:hypothetical protein
MNKISEFIIRLLSPKPGAGEILIMPYVTKSQKGITKPRKNNPPEQGAVDSTPIAPLPGQIPLDAALQECDPDYEKARSDWESNLTSQM